MSDTDELNKLRNVVRETIKNIRTQLDVLEAFAMPLDELAKEISDGLNADGG